MTTTQLKVAAKLVEVQRPIEHWRGGYWTYVGCPSNTRNGIPIPAWAISTITVRAMRRRGWLGPVATKANLAVPAWAQKLELTHDGVAAYDATRHQTQEKVT